MFDVWLGNVELTTLTLLLSVFVFLLLALCTPRWDGLGYVFLAIFAGIMLAACRIAWGIWAIINKSKS